MVIYETINLINGKRYIGKDTHNDSEYLGSGRILTKAIAKYGKENFKKIILECCNSIEELNSREKHWIKTTNAQKSVMYYNVGEGGEGGDNITHNPNRDKFIKKMTEINNDPQYIRTRNGHKESTKENQKLAAKGRYTLDWFKQRYGDIEGLQKYETRRQSLKNRNYSKFRNSATGRFSKSQT
jgi:hypothetical protein